MIVTNHAAVLVSLVSDTPNLQMTILYRGQLTTPFRQDKIKTGRQISYRVFGIRRTPWEPHS